MRFQMAALCLLATVFGYGSVASAHIGFDGDFECVDSYETGCILFNAAPARRNMHIFFDGTVEENGAKCEIRTAKLSAELVQAAKSLGIEATAFKFKSIEYGYMNIRRLNQYRCSYEISTTRRDLRFSAHHFNRRFWTDREEQAGICMADVREAQAIPNSIGAAKWMSGALLQGEMCYTTYALAGLDRIGTDVNGKERVIKFGTREYNLVTPKEASTTAADLQGGQ